ncbi:peptidylprolyl isomerase [Lysinibacillus sphaericus]|uniref:peptidylprolyl isomerase n=1 Tax=Lysinibacillus sphaericus TaxID=1421 RepID=UPI0018CF26E4|nr:peptidylprolyl isomerase [Lysinibacillus sphaericus]MBG9689770.1 peptidylprolyl isomerase [Lysinibacillus sphaericus]
MYTRNKGIYVVLSLLAIMFVLTGCSTAKDSKKTETVDYASKVKENPIVTITMSNDEKIVIELEPTVAPNTVANFISLVEEGFYDGLIFHRVIPDFMIQGGDPSGNGTGGPDYSIDGEFSSNGWDNSLKHERGVISMARSQDPNSAGSQFFIMVKETTDLDGKYAAFGKVIEGMETVDAIVAAERDATDKPLEDQQMKKVEVDTKGFNYPAPKVNK